MAQSLEPQQFTATAACLMKSRVVGCPRAQPLNPSVSRKPHWEAMYRAVEPYRRVIEAVNGFQGSRMLQQGVVLDLFTKLASDGKTLLQLARQIEVDARALEILLNGLVALGFLAKQSERYRSTPLSQTYLARGGPKYIGSFVRYQARRWSDWEQLGDAIRSGEPVRPPDLYPDDPEDLELYLRGLHELALAGGDARRLAHVLPMQRCRTLLDLGGGPGTYAAMLCRSFPNLHAVVVDLPRTLEITRRILRDFDLTGNVSTRAADVVRDAIPGGPYDAVLISNLLHGENEQTDARLLRKVHGAIVPGGLLIVREHCMSADRTEPDQGAVFALSLLLGTRGRTYTFQEMAGWIESAGFCDLTEIRPEPPVATSLLLALRPGGRPVAVLSRPAAAISKPAARPEPPALHDWWAANSTQAEEDGDSPEVSWSSSPALPADRQRTGAARPASPSERPPTSRRSNSNGPKKRPAAKPRVAAGRKSRAVSRSKRV